MSTIREIVLAALEQACREAFESPWRDWARAVHKTDGDWALCGAFTVQVLDFCHPTIGVSKVRDVLECACAEGLVLRHQSRPRGLISWWPVGLLAKLQSERNDGEKA